MGEVHIKDCPGFGEVCDTRARTAVTAAGGDRGPSALHPKLRIFREPEADKSIQHPEESSERHL